MTAVVRPVEYATRPAVKKRRWPVWLAVLLIVGLFFAILVPSMCRSSEVSNRIKSASNLRQIGLALASYAGEHGGCFPADFGVLVRTSDLTPDVFTSPSDGAVDRAPGKVPADWARALVDEPAKYCSYRFVAAGRRAAGLPTEAVLAYETMPDYGDGMHVLLADNTVDWVASKPEGKPDSRYAKLKADAAAGVWPLTVPQ